MDRWLRYKVWDCSTGGIEGEIGDYRVRRKGEKGGTRNERFETGIGKVSDGGQSRRKYVETSWPSRCE